MSVVFGLILAFAPVLSIAAVPLVPIPIAYVSRRHGLLVGVLASIGTGAICFLLSDPFSALLVFLLAALVGIGAGAALGRGIGRQWLLFAVSGLFLTAFVAWGAAALASAGMTPVDAVNSLTDQVVQAVQQSPALLGGQDWLGQLRDTMSMIPYLLPALLMVAAMGFAAVMIYMSRRFFMRMGLDFPEGGSFKDLRVHFSLAYAMIAGLVCYLVSPHIADAYSSAVYLIGVNLLIISQTLFFVQALSIAHFFLSRLKASRVRSVIVYICLGLLQVTLSLPSWLGLFDIWLDYRRRFTSRIKPSQN